MSHFENIPLQRELARLLAAIVRLGCVHPEGIPGAEARALELEAMPAGLEYSLVDLLEAEIEAHTEGSRVVWRDPAEYAGEWTRLPGWEDL